MPASEPETIDARGLLCPLPVLKLLRHLRHPPPSGASLRRIDILTTDPAAGLSLRQTSSERGWEWQGEEVQMIDGESVLRTRLTCPFSPPEP